MCFPKEQILFISVPVFLKSQPEEIHSSQTLILCENDRSSSNFDLQGFQQFETSCCWVLLKAEGLDQSSKIRVDLEERLSTLVRFLRLKMSVNSDHKLTGTCLV